MESLQDNHTKPPGKVVAVTCNLCGADDTRLVGFENGWRVCQCQRCGLVYVNPRPVLEVDYSDYFEDLGEDSEQRLASIRLESFQEGLDILARSCPTRGRLLDVGCGNGYFLRIALKHHWEAFGVDTSSMAAKYCKEKLGINISHGTLEEAKFPDEYFQAVTVWLCLEHLPDPQGTLSEINRIMALDALLIIRVPNIESWYFKYKRRRNISILDGAPHHLYGFSPISINNLLYKTNFRDIRIMPGRINKNSLGMPFNDGIASFLNYLFMFLYLSKKQWVFSPSLLALAKK